jgi:LysM repeat protein
MATAMVSVPVAARTRETERPPLVVKVGYGDSLWTIAQRCGVPNGDVREIVDAIMVENGVDPGQLQPGEVLRIPAEYALLSR